MFVMWCLSFSRLFSPSRDNPNAVASSDSEEDEDTEESEEEQQRVLKVKKYGPLAPQDPLVGAMIDIYFTL